MSRNKNFHAGFFSGQIYAKIHGKDSQQVEDVVEKAEQFHRIMPRSSNFTYYCEIAEETYKDLYKAPNSNDQYFAVLNKVNYTNFYFQMSKNVYFYDFKPYLLFSRRL